MYKSAVLLTSHVYEWRERIMRVVTGTMIAAMLLGLTGCGSTNEPPVSEDEVTTDKPVIDMGTLVEDPGSTTNGAEGGPTDADSEAPPFDGNSEAPPFDGNSEAPKFDADSEAPPFDPGDTGDDEPAKDDEDASKKDSPPDDSASVTQPELDEFSAMLLRLSDQAERDNSIRTIRDQGPDVVPQLVKALDHDDWRVRAGAAFALSELGSDAQPALAKLEEVSKSAKHESVRDAAVWAIAAISDKK
jgi:hypothetical protein